MNLKNITRGELIGKQIIVYEAKNPSMKNMTGKIVDETRNTIKIQTKKGIKTAMKNTVTIEIIHDGKKVRIHGEKIVGKPEERIKKKLK
jgi:ribonuclease P protein subunit POP4